MTIFYRFYPGDLIYGLGQRGGVGWGDVGGDQILLKPPETSPLCSGEPTAETKSMLDETVEQLSTGG